MSPHKQKMGTPSRRGAARKDDGHLFNATDLAELQRDGLTEPLADALDTIATALRENLAQQAHAPAPPAAAPIRPRTLTLHSKSIGLHLTLVVNPRDTNKE